ncbi:winged helix-turn-helix domain-containing protein [Mobilicoccus pelagius]|uniref:ArsR family transcriptional regulator n=1 Tax=Mobilicoccus pelagius NBRC 104925 TaxID=1089455 RepID=H5UNN6_9MICO|nr:helix-turn-helix domain-containing protein [Mobilicoccus pelagius]GAB47344.1 hypothetical protein MOPEL_009_00340 [Mobilicoccus pelagius NBRC 104925]
MTDTEDRVAALEAAVEQLRSAVASDRGPREASPGDTPANTPDVSDGDGPPEREGDDDRFWMLQGLRDRHPEGAVGFSGHLRLPAGEARWQWGRLTDDLLADDWTRGATALAALGHPVRLAILQHVLTGTTTTAALAESDGLGTTGQLHHHLRALVAAGWLASAGRGRYSVPPHRIVPLLVVVSATLTA